MNFGYFTLSDNRYPNNERTPERLLHEIYEQALYADQLDFHSAWIGEHHFNLLGVNASPHVLLAQIAGATKNIRLAPAVVLLPIHHPLMVAEEWATLDQLSGGRVDFAAGRGYDAKEYAPFDVAFDKSAEIFEEGLQVLWRAWTETGPFAHDGTYYRFPAVDVRPKPLQQPLRPFVASFSRLSMEIAAKNDWNIIYAPFAATMVYGSLANGVRAYREACEAHGRAARLSNCSYFIHIADTSDEERFGREALIDYFHSILPSFPSDLATAPPNLRYFVDIVERLKRATPEGLDSNSILLGSPQAIIEQLARVEASGISEVILYFNYGRKPHTMVKEQMHRFAAEIAPALRGDKYVEAGLVSRG